MTEFMHTLVVPQFAIDSANIMSAPHKLPWVDDGSPFVPWSEEWVITEEEFGELDFI